MKKAKIFIENEKNSRDLTPVVSEPETESSTTPTSPPTTLTPPPKLLPCDSRSPVPTASAAAP